MEFMVALPYLHTALCTVQCTSMPRYSTLYYTVVLLLLTPCTVPFSFLTGPKLNTRCARAGTPSLTEGSWSFTSSNN